MTLIVGVILFTSPDSFEARATIWVDDSSGLPLAVGALQMLGLPTANQSDYIFALLDSDDLKLKTFDSLTEKQKEIFWSQADIEHRDRKSVVKSVGGFVQVGGDAPIEIVARTETPELSLALVENMLKHLSLRVQANTSSDVKRIVDVLEENRREARKSEMRLLDFVVKNEIGSIPELEARQRIESLSDWMKELGLVVASLEGADAQLEAPGNLEQQLALTSERAGLAARASSLRDQLEEQQRNLLGLPRLEIEYSRLRLELETRGQVIQELTKQFELARVSGAEAAPFEIIDKPYLPERRAPKRTIFFILLGAFIGGTCGGVLSLLNLVWRGEFLDNE